MRIISTEDFLENKDEFSKKIENGELFIYPTDTIYGLGVDATNEAAVLKLRNAKMQHGRPLSVIAPSIEWIKENCVMNGRGESWVKKLPGPYTLVFKLKNKSALAKSVNESGSIGIRIPDHPISDFVRSLGVPIITTSANISGKKFMTSLEDMDPILKMKVDFFVDDGEVRGKPSTIVFLDKEDVEIKERGV